MDNTNPIDNALASIGDELVAEELQAIEPDAQLAQRRGGDDWVIEWYLRKQAECDKAEEFVKEHAANLMKQIDARRKGLNWRYGSLLREECEKKLAENHKGKSIETMFGRFGYRTSGGRKTVVIDDEQAAIASCERFHAEAVKKTLSKTELQKALENGVDIEGAHIETTPKEEKFFCGKQVFDAPQLEVKHDNAE